MSIFSRIKKRIQNKKQPTVADFLALLTNNEINAVKNMFGQDLSEFKVHIGTEKSYLYEVYAYHGKTAIKHFDGALFLGSLNFGMAEGYCEEYNCDGGYFKGNFKGGKKNGSGKEFNKAENSLYSGDYLNDEKDDFGTLVEKHPRGKTIYEGSFAKGKKDGRGKLTVYNDDGLVTNVIDGIWTKDEYNVIVSSDIPY